MFLIESSLEYESEEASIGSALSLYTLSLPIPPQILSSLIQIDSHSIYYNMS